MSDAAHAMSDAAPTVSDGSTPTTPDSTPVAPDDALTTPTPADLGADAVAPFGMIDEETAAAPVVADAPSRQDRRDGPLWFKNAIIYEVLVRAFQDSNGDGVGDFPGLISRLDYLQWLGVDCLWLLPFNASPLRDGGYDIADYKSVLPSFGTVGDVRRLLDEAHARGIRVIMDLVVNHTSDQHPWFQEARSSPSSPRHDWYVWSDDPTRYADARIIFTDTETSNWTFDDKAGAYFWHRFFSHQPDLNYDNPAVHEAMLDVFRFWLDLGMDGFRLDAVPYLFEREGTICENLPETHEFLAVLRATIDREYPNRVLLAEANQWPEDVVPYFGTPERPECHMNFHFPLMPRMFLALRKQDSRPITEILARTPAIPQGAQWGIFLRNHDELTLEMVTTDERDYLWREYARDPRMKLNLGIRRRLAPLLDGDRQSVELFCALLFSLPGTPVMYYGDEIGMGDNIYLGDRDGVRTPMQWNGDRNGGFSRADAAQLYLPASLDPIHGFAVVNVEAAQRNESSLLHWVKNAIAVRQNWPVFGEGVFTPLDVGDRAVFAYLRTLDDVVVLCLNNLSRQARAAEIDLSDFAGRTPVELRGGVRFPRIGDARYVVTLGPHEAFWFSLERDADAPNV